MFPAKFWKWYSICGIFIGAMAAFSFWGMNNHQAAALCLVSSLFAAIYAFDAWKLHKIFIGPSGKSQFTVHHTSSFQHACQHAVAGFGTIGGLALMAYTIWYGVANGQALTGQSVYMSSVWSFMSAKWAFALWRHIFSTHVNEHIECADIQEGLIQKV